MWTKNQNPSKSDWYLTKNETGEKEILKWNAPNQFWVDMAGKTFKPDEVYLWLDDNKVEKNKAYYYQFRDNDEELALFVTNCGPDLEKELKQLFQEWWETSEDFEEWFEENYNSFDLPEGAVISRIFCEEIYL